MGHLVMPMICTRPTGLVPATEEDDIYVFFDLPVNGIWKLHIGLAHPLPTGLGPKLAGVSCSTRSASTMYFDEAL
jgi:hypothetical protein